MIARYCVDPQHEGDPLIPHPLDAFAIRLEARRLHDLSGRSFRNLLSPVCRECRDRWFNLTEEALLEQIELFADA